MMKNGRPQGEGDTARLERGREAFNFSHFCADQKVTVEGRGTESSYHGVSRLMAGGVS